MNKTIIFYTFSNIFSQVLTKLLIVLQIIIVFFVAILKIDIRDDVINSISFFNISMNEPFIIRSFSTTFIGLFLFIFYFLLILIAMRLFAEGYKDPILDIVIPKLKKSSHYYYSQLTGYILWFSSNLILFVLLTTSLISFQLDETIFPLVLTTLHTLLFSLLFVGIISSFLSLLFDGYTASLFLLLPFMFGGSILGILSSSENTIYVFKIIFPLSNIRHFVSSIVIDKLVFDLNSLFVLPILFLVIIYSSFLFNKKWE